MKTIYKTVIEPNSLSGAAYPIRIPCRKGSKPISVGKQGPHCCVWFETPTEGEVDSYFVLLCVGTGHGSGLSTFVRVWTEIKTTFVST